MQGPTSPGGQWYLPVISAGGGTGFRALLALGAVLVLSQFAFYLAIYAFLRTHLPVWRFMVYALPVFAFGVWGPLWTMRTALTQHWALLPVQLGMFASSVVAALLGLIFIERQLPSRFGWLGLALVVAGVVVSAVG